jgi:RNA 2',3'-cyclic 3'-phosphodiesterase
VNLPASVTGRERARLFCALRLPGQALEALSKWQAEHIERGRVVPRDQLHVTLAFLGHRSVAELQLVLEALREAARAAPRIRLVPESYRETRSVGMLVLSDVGGGATRVAKHLQGRLAEAGVYEVEKRPWLAHVTVVRFRERPRLKPPLPGLGEISPSDAAAYHSVLRSGGAQYFVVESFALGG